MKLSTETYPLDLTSGFEGAVTTLKEIGFDCYDLSIFNLNKEGDPFGGADYRERAVALRKTAERVGIFCNQSHGPYPYHKPHNPKWNEEIFGWCVRALEITSLVGGKTCILHPFHDWTAQENATRIYLPLQPYCKKYGVRIALENMWGRENNTGKAIPSVCGTAQSFLEHLELLDPEWFVACLDIGHAEMVGEETSAAQFILALGDRLKALHVHDNDLKNDLHIHPYGGQIDWEPIYAALRKVGYGGEFTFEADSFVHKFPQELRYDATVMLLKIGRYMIERIEEGQPL